MVSIKFNNDYKLDLKEIKKLFNYFKENDIVTNEEYLINLITSNNSLSSILSSMEDSENELLSQMIDINNSIVLAKSIENRDGFVMKSGLQIYFEEANKYKLLTFEEEQELGKLVKNNDKEAINTLVKHNLRLAASIAYHFRGRGLEEEDLIQCANLGLIKAATKFDYTKRVRFSTYATYWIRQTIIRELQYTGSAIRLPSYLAESLNKVKLEEKKLSVKLGRVPTNEELALSLKLSKEDIIKVKDSDYDYVSTSLKLTSESETTIEDTIPDEKYNTEKDVIHSALKVDLNNALTTLTQKEQDILSLYYGLNGSDRHTLEEISAMYHVTIERIRQIRRHAEKKIRTNKKYKHLGEYIGVTTNKVDNEFRVKHTNTTIYDLVSDITIDKSLVNFYIDRLSPYSKYIIYIIYGNDLDNPMRDDNKYDASIQYKFNAEILPELKNMLSKSHTKVLSK